MAQVKPELLLITDAAEQLGVSVATLRRWADSGKVPFVRLPSGHRRFQVEDIVQLRREMGLDRESQDIQHP